MPNKEGTCTVNVIIWLRILFQYMCIHVFFQEAKYNYMYSTDKITIFAKYINHWYM